MDSPMSIPPSYALVTGLAVGFVVMLALNDYVIKRLLAESGKYHGVMMFVLFNVGVYGTALNAVFALVRSN
jgi:hypothetical protein